MSVLFQALARAERDTLPPRGRSRIAWPLGAGDATPRRWLLPAELGGGLALLLAGVATGIALAPAPGRIAAAPEGVTQRLAPIPAVPAHAPPPMPAPPPAPAEDPPKLAALPPPVQLARRPHTTVPAPREAPAAVSSPPSSPKAARPTEAPPASPTSAASAWTPRISLAPGVARAQPVAVPAAAEGGQILPDGGLEIAAILYRDAGIRANGAEPTAILPAQMRRYREALLDAEQLLHRHRDSAPLAMQAGLLHLRLGEHARGLDNLRRAAELRPDSPTYKVALAIGLDYAGARQEALALYQQAQAMITDGPGQHWRSPLPVSLAEMRGRIDHLRRLG